jgi:hypothetical protein
MRAIASSAVWMSRSRRTALERVARLIVGLAGGRIDGAPVDLVHEPVPARRIQLRESRVAACSARRPADEIAKLLESVGFKVGSSFPVQVPSWRLDVAGEVDSLKKSRVFEATTVSLSELRPFRPTAVGDDPQ